MTFQICLLQPAGMSSIYHENMSFSAYFTILSTSVTLVKLFYFIVWLMQEMSNSTEILAKDLIEIVMINAINSSIMKMERANDENSESEDPPPGIVPQLLSQQVSQANMNISQILQQVAELAENLREDLQNFQIGDYVISMNASPLEIQLKQAISSFQIADEEPKNKIMITKGEGDGDHHEPITHDLTDKPISINRCNNEQLSLPLTSSSSLSPVCNVMMTQDMVDGQLDIDHQLTENLERKKYMRLGERIRRIFRFSFSRRSRNK